MDEVQLLVHTPAPDLTRFPEYVSIAAILLVAGGVALQRINAGQQGSPFCIIAGNGPADRL